LGKCGIDVNVPELYCVNMNRTEIDRVIWCKYWLYKTEGGTLSKFVLHKNWWRFIV